MVAPRPTGLYYHLFTLQPGAAALHKHIKGDIMNIKTLRLLQLKALSLANDWPPEVREYHKEELTDLSIGDAATIETILGVSND